MPEARSTPNIALIKYWGNRQNAFRIPMADSLSITLDAPCLEVMVEHADAFSVRSLAEDGSPKTLKEKDILRLETHLALSKQFLGTLGMTDAIPHSVTLTIRSRIPQAIGIASSAAVFSALATTYAEFMRSHTNAPIAHRKSSITNLSVRDISILARLGSGSAARSIFGGFSALRAGSGISIDAAYGEQIAPESHWKLWDFIVVPSYEEKKVGSTEGHTLAHTSPLFRARIEEIPRRMEECTAAILDRDFEKLKRVTEEDTLDMHSVMETQDPPLRYLTKDTHRITRAITDLRKREHLPVLFTMDAGPTVHLICTDEAVDAIRSFAHAQKGCTVYETKIGGGSTLIGA